MAYRFSLTPRLVTLGLVSLVALLVLMFLLGMQIGQRLAPAPGRVSDKQAQPSAAYAQPAHAAQAQADLQRMTQATAVAPTGTAPTPSPAGVLAPPAPLYPPAQPRALP